MFNNIENEIIALAVNDIKLEVMSSDKKPDSKSKCFLSHSIYVKKLCLEGESGVIWSEGEEPQESGGNGEHEHRTDARTGKYYKAHNFYNNKYKIIIF